MVSGRIPQSFIDDLLARTDIVQLIDARVPLKKAGTEYKACCPFHNEKTPSFTVSPSKQFYHCFGCGAHGSAIGFLLEYERMDFVEAVEALARDAGLEVPREGGDPREPTLAPMQAILRRCADLYRERLAQEPDARRYLSARAVDAGTAERFGLGYAPERWDWLMGQFADEQRPLLEQAGMLTRNERGRVYDRFRGRLMFPIQDRRGAVIGFGGRVLGEATTKYLNSPETPLFHKGRELYGLHQALHATQRPQSLIVVEGYMDVIALVQHGVEGAVATLGTATTDEHLQRLLRHSSELVFCFDGDAAGRRAAGKALDVALPHLLPGRDLRFMFLAQGEDPDSLVRAEGREGFRRRLAEAQPLADFLFETLWQGLDLATEAGRAALVERFRPAAAKMPDTLYAGLLRDRLAELVRVDRQAIDKALAGPAGTRPAIPGGRAARRPGRSVAMTPMRLAIACLLKDPTLVSKVDQGAAFLSGDQPGLALLNRLLHRCRADPPPTPGALLESFRGDPDESVIGKLFAWSAPEPAEAESNLDLAFADALDRLRQRHRFQRREQLIALSRQRPLSAAEKSELKKLFEAAD